MTGRTSAGSNPIARQEVGATGGLAGAVGQRVRRGLVRIRRRVPDGRVEPVEDADEPVASRPQRPVQAHPEVGRQRLRGEPRRDGVDDLRALDAREQQVDPRRVEPDDAVARPQAELGQAVARRPAVVGEVVQGHDHGGAADDRIVGVALVAVDRGRPGVPVVEVEHVERPVVRAEGLQRGPAEQPEPPGVVGVVARRVAVEALAIERGGMVDQAEAVAVGGDVEDRDRAVARRRARIRDADHGGPLENGRDRHAPVARQEDVDRRLDRAGREPAERPGQRVDDVGQPAGLGPRFAFGGEHRHAHRHRTAIVRAAEAGPGAG